MNPLKLSLLTVQAVCLCVFHIHAQDSLFNIPENANQELPPGVPRVVETNGQVLFIDTRFTTPAFEEEGLKLVIDEANKVVSELNLRETIPITRSNLTRAIIGPFGFTYKTKALGNIATTNYSYGVERGYKFNELHIANYDECFLNYRTKYHLSASEIDTNAAYQLATQWLAAVHMDVNGLSRDCDVRVALSSDLDGSERLHGKITPVYFVSWTPRVKTERPSDSSAYVELFLPTKTLLQLCVNNSKYILRPPVAFNNLAALFPGRATITTNRPVELKVIDASKQFPIVEPKWPQNPPRQ